MADDTRKQIRGRMKKCPVCGREFWCYDPVLWAYRERNGRGEPKGHICSWGCQVKHNAELEAKRIERLEAKQAKYNARLEAKRIERLEAKQEKRGTNDRGIEWCLLEGLDGVMKNQKIQATRLGGMAGICRTSIVKYRYLQSKCKAQKAQILADALGVPLEDLLTKKEDTV